MHGYKEELLLYLKFNGNAKMINNIYNKLIFKYNLWLIFVIDSNWLHSTVHAVHVQSHVTSDILCIMQQVISNLLAQ